MEDLTIDLEGGRLNCRAAGIIIHDGKVLFHKNPADVYYALVGGRVKIGESSDKTVKREIEEELGKKIDVIECMATIENFFELENRNFHEYPAPQLDRSPCTKREEPTLCYKRPRIL